MRTEAMVPGVDPVLWSRASAVRERVWGNQVFLRGIIEFSNYCSQNCHYCGLRRENARIRRYRLDSETVYRCAERIKALDLGTVVMQSGEDPGYDAADLARLIERIKKMGLAVTLSLGSRSPENYRQWRDARADRYLLKFETADPQAYAGLRPGCRLQERIDCLHTLRELGYETGTGMIVGLPGNGPEIREKDALLLAGLKPDMVSVSPFVPHPDTPLREQPECPTAAVLNAMAGVRVLLPEAHMPVTSALGLRGDSLRLAALRVADVLMPSLTPESVRTAYTIYPGKNEHTDGPEKRATAMRNLLLASGFVLPSGPGGAWRIQKEPS